MFEAFSSRYLFGRLTAYGETRQTIALNDIQYSMLLDSIAATEVVLKIGNRHVVAEGDSGVPMHAVAVPSAEYECEDAWPREMVVYVARDENVGQFV
jgi:hypothetical protein